MKRLRTFAPRLVSIAVHIEGFPTLYLTRKFSSVGYDLNGALESVRRMTWESSAGIQRWSESRGLTLRVMVDARPKREEEEEMAVVLPQKDFGIFNVNILPNHQTSSQFPVDLALQLCHAMSFGSIDPLARPTLRLRNWRTWQDNGGDGLLELLEHISEYTHLVANIDVVYKKSPVAALAFHDALAFAH
ncbi:hypothetical protein NCC49_003304 [Naganishia albida]|nr:hypothetical protein NCC49_003304 [Naganishia albida]